MAPSLNSVNLANATSVDGFNWDRQKLNKLLKCINHCQQKVDDGKNRNREPEFFFLTTENKCMTWLYIKNKAIKYTDSAVTYQIITGSFIIFNEICTQ